MNTARSSISDREVARIRCWVPSPQSISDQPPDADARSARPLTLRVLLGVPDAVPRNWNSMPIFPWWRCRHYRAAASGVARAPGTGCFDPGEPGFAPVPPHFVANCLPARPPVGTMSLLDEQPTAIRQPCKTPAL